MVPGGPGPARRGADLSRPPREPVYAVTIALVRVVVRVLFRVEVEGTLPATGALVVAPVHTSYLDPCVIAVVLVALGRRGRFLTTEAVFRVPLVGPVLRRGRFIPVPTSGGTIALDPAAAELRAGEVVVIYPEAHLPVAGSPHAARPGVARLARATGAPVVPIGHAGIERSARRLGWLRRRRAAVVVGQPFTPADGDDRAAAEEVLARARVLAERAAIMIGRVPEPHVGER